MPYSHNLPVTRLIAAALIASALLVLNACSAQSSKSGVRHLGAPIEGYSHTSDGINHFSVNGNGGPNVGPHQGGGKQNCCVTLPVTWQPGLTVVVEWEEDPEPFSSRKWSEKPFTDAWRERMAEQSKEYTQHRVEVEVAPYDALGVVNVHFLPCNQVKVTAGIYGFGHPQYPYIDSLNMEEPDQCPATSED